MKIIETGEYVSVLRELTEDGQQVNMRIAGNSMAPFLVHERDYIRFQKPTQPLKKGDMVFFQRQNGQYVMHRILRAAPEGYYITGDAQQQVEGPVRREQIFAIITQVQRKGKWIGPEDFWWKFFSGPWLNLLPLRHTLIRMYGLLKGK